MTHRRPGGGRPSDRARGGIGELIHDRLEEVERSQAWLASQVGYSPKHVSNVIRDKARVTVDLAVRIEIALDLDAEYLLTLDFLPALDEARLRIRAERNECDNQARGRRR